MAEEYEQLACGAFEAYLEANLGTFLAAVESSDGLANGSLGRPVEVVRASVPTDPRFPLIQIYDVKTLPKQAGHRNFLAQVTIEVLITDVVSGTDIEGGEDRMRRWLRAIRNAVAADYQIGTAATANARVTGAIWTESGRILHEHFEAVTRIGRGLLFECEVFDSR